MVQSISTSEAKATTKAAKLVDQGLAGAREELTRLVASMLSGEKVTPHEFMEFEEKLAEELRETGRVVVEETVNRVEKETTQQFVLHHGLIYRRLKEKTRNQHISTFFGSICVRRHVYRYCDSRDVSERCIFPLELRLGLIEGVTPALGTRIGRQTAKMPQQQVLHWLRDEHHVRIGAGRLRKFVARLSGLMAEHQHSLQVAVLVDALDEASRSRGSRKPVLAVGRDGVTTCENRHSFWEVATAATVTVFDRRGKRVLTVYLARCPELGQATMSQQLTTLITDVLMQWEGPLPTLAYVADSGSNESTYYGDALSRMHHPRTGQPLQWQRVVDYYHVAERVWAISEALFGKRHPRYWRWARRMLRVLKNKPNGPKRLLHSAAAIAAVRTMGKARKQQLEKALNYIRKRTKWMQYTEYRARHIPIGSGITEAACKTIFTQRMKQSGMRWSRQGAATVLLLRVLLLSGIWDKAYDRVLARLAAELPQPYERGREINARIAA